MTLTDIDHKKLRAAVKAKLDRFHDLLHSDVPVARQTLRKLLVEPMRFEPTMQSGHKTFKFKGKMKIGPY